MTSTATIGCGLRRSWSATFLHPAPPPKKKKIYIYIYIYIYIFHYIYIYIEILDSFLDSFFSRKSFLILAGSWLLLLVILLVVGSFPLEC